MAFLSLDLSLTTDFLSRALPVDSGYGTSTLLLEKRVGTVSPWHEPRRGI